VPDAFPPLDVRGNDGLSLRPPQLGPVSFRTAGISNQNGERNWTAQGGGI